MSIAFALGRHCARRAPKQLSRKIVASEVGSRNEEETTGPGDHSARRDGCRFRRHAFTAAGSAKTPGCKAPALSKHATFASAPKSAAASTNSWCAKATSVKAGQVLMTFDDKELAGLAPAIRANAEKAKRGYRPEEIAEARAAAMQAKADYELKKNGYRKEDIAAAQADLDRAAADETRAQLDFQRYDALAKKDLVSKQQRDTAEANWKMALAQKENAQHKLDELQRGYRPEEIASAEARYLQAQATCEKLQRGNRREDVESAQASLMPTTKRDSANAKSSRLPRPPSKFSTFVPAI